MPERPDARGEPEKKRSPAEAGRGITDRAGMDGREAGAGSAPPRSVAAGLVSLGWLLGGVVLTLLVIFAARATDRSTLPPAPHASPTRLHPTAGTERLSAGSPREQFATLYLSYLLNSYYVRSRGFCQPLLQRVCLALHHAELLADKRDCEQLPNDELVLAIGRYQHRVGLPVDGKAGPETVRMMLGGDFSNRRGMEEAYCTAASPPPTEPVARPLSTEAH